MKAKLTPHKEFSAGQVDERIYGSFIEHLGRADLAWMTLEPNRIGVNEFAEWARRADSPWLQSTSRFSAIPLSGGGRWRLPPLPIFYQIAVFSRF